MKRYITGTIVGLILVTLLFPPIRPFFVVGEWQQAVVTQFGKFKRTCKRRAFTGKRPWWRTSRCMSGVFSPVTPSPGII